MRFQISFTDTKLSYVGMSDGDNSSLPLRTQGFHGELAKRSEDEKRVFDEKIFGCYRFGRHCTVQVGQLVVRIGSLKGVTMVE
jgi:hypothetical protein